MTKITIYIFIHNFFWYVQEYANILFLLEKSNLHPLIFSFLLFFFPPTTHSTYKFHILKTHSTYNWSRTMARSSIKYQRGATSGNINVDSRHARPMTDNNTMMIGWVTMDEWVKSDARTSTLRDNCRQQQFEGFASSDALSLCFAWVLDTHCLCPIVFNIIIYFWI